MDEREQPADRELGDLVRAAAKRYEAPAELRARIVADTQRHATTPPRRPQIAFNPFRTFTSWRIGVAFACGALLSWLATTMLAPAGIGSRLEDDVIGAHVRSVTTARMTDVASSDQHTVKPWLSSRLDYSPPAVDLASEGFPLTGGRLDYVGGRTVATLVYQRNRHWIDVFVWPVGADGPASTRASATKNGFNVVRWQSGGMQFWAVTDASAADLANFAASLQRNAAGAG